MDIIAQSHPHVVGVDTHARSHALSILIAATGAIVDEGQFPATEAGMARAIAWVARRTNGDLATLWVVECVGTYGARLASLVTQAGYRAVEAARMDARANRGVGKSDPLDARRIAACCLAALNRSAPPSADRHRVRSPARPGRCPRPDDHPIARQPSTRSPRYYVASHSASTHAAH